MPEVTADATLLIATSWQALGRIETGDERTMITNCTVVIVFAGFFIEANLNHIIDVMGKAADVNEFAGTTHPGLGAKLAWFYDAHIATEKASDKDQAYAAVREQFPEFEEIQEFRNKVSHGEVDRATANVEDAKRLRAAAKGIVDRLILAVNEAGCHIEKGTTYNMAIASNDLTD